MTTNIQSIGFTASEALIIFVNEKTARLGQFLESIISSEVALSLDNAESGENKVCNIRLVIPGNDLLASARCKSFEEATAQATDALIKQIDKHKTKMFSKRNQSVPQDLSDVEEIAE
jgi:ribosomal subunit interface protein